MRMTRRTRNWQADDPPSKSLSAQQRIENEVFVRLGFGGRVFASRTGLGRLYRALSGGLRRRFEGTAHTTTGDPSRDGQRQYQNERLCIRDLQSCDPICRGTRGKRRQPCGGANLTLRTIPLSG